MRCVGTNARVSGRKVGGPRLITKADGTEAPAEPSAGDEQTHRRKHERHHVALLVPVQAGRHEGPGLVQQPRRGDEQRGQLDQRDVVGTLGQRQRAGAPAPGPRPALMAFSAITPLITG